MFVAVNGCLESSPQIQQVWGPVYLAVFAVYGLCHPDRISGDRPDGSVYSPLIRKSHSLVASTVRASAMSFLVFDMRLYLNDRGTLLSLGACEQCFMMHHTIPYGLRETLMLVVFMCFWVLQVFVDALHCEC